jgi:hypothetical protein
MPSDAKEWTSDQLQFQLWLALPTSARKPKTQRAFAELIGVHESTLSDWKALPGFRSAVSALALDLLKDDVPDVLFALRKYAKKGSAQHIKMFLEMLGLYEEKHNLQVTVKGYVGISPDDWDDESAG